MAASTSTKFVIITHNPITMARMSRLFGVTMAEQGGIAIGVSGFGDGGADTGGGVRKDLDRLIAPTSICKCKSA